ncbi:MAG: type II toxin-antitoxin system HicA family toxin [Candidatus Hydrogenedentes bacterium]|nr:type II toxin-antitoxin system HicA family toxin [Candidatus Hydrogenedentota bacterium]
MEDADHRETVRAFKQVRYGAGHRTGSHVILRQRQAPHRRTTVPNHRELARSALRPLVRRAGLTVEDSNELR